MAEALSSRPPAVITILETARVSPPAPHRPPSESIPFTFFDVIWISSSPVDRLFYYRHVSGEPSSLLLLRLKSSLSLALHTFFPLCGRIRRRPDDASGELYEIHCSPDDSIPFTVAEVAGADFQQLVGRLPRDYHSTIKPLVPKLLPQNSSGQQVLAVQVTLFPEQGAVVGVTVNHSACDGATSSRFLKLWACISRGSDVSGIPQPVVDRSLISDPRGLYSAFLHAFAKSTLRDLKKDGDGDGDLQLASFLLDGDTIGRLKELVAGTRPSTFAGALALVWCCYASVTEMDPADTAHLIFPLDCRDRLRPAVPENYFGNCIAPCFVEGIAGELTGENGLAIACGAIVRSIAEATPSPLEGAEGWPDRIIRIAATRPLSVAGSPRFGVYEVDFGWGRPERVEVTSIAKTGAVAVAETRDQEEGGGGRGLEFNVALSRPEMDRFRHHLSGRLTRLSATSPTCQK